jgi:hypothetical protein
VLFNSQPSAHCASTFATRPANKAKWGRQLGHSVVACVLGPSSQELYPTPTSTAHKETKWQRYHSAAAVTAACSPKKNVFTDVPPTQAFFGARPREDPRRRRSSLRVEASAELEIFFSHAACRSAGPVSLRHLLSHSGLGTEQRDGRHHGGHTVKQHEGLYIYRKIELTKSSAPWLSQIALPMDSGFEGL